MLRVRLKNEMKILHLIHKSQHRGAETFACQLAKHQRHFGHQVRIIAIYYGKSQLNWEDSIDTIGGKQQYILDIKAWKRLAEEVKRFQPDVIQANSGDTLKYAVFSKKIFNWQQPIIFRNASAVGRYIKSPLQKGFNKFLYKNVDRIISVSLASEKDILHHFPFLKGKTEVIPVGLEPISKIEEFCFKPEGHEHIVHVGGFTFEKNHFELLKIFQSVLKVKPNVHLHLVGDGPLKVDIEEQVKKIKLTQNITFYGFVNNPMTYIKAADVLVLPSIIEGLPGVILEAMICKTPVVAFDVGGISEILTDTTGSLITQGNNDAFTSAILNTLIFNNEEKIGKAYHLATSNFMNSKLALKFVNSYEGFVSTLE